jgi:hypothetical protein
VIYRILGNRLGSAWVRSATERDASLAEVLRPTVGPLDWYPVERLIGLLHSVPAAVRDPMKVARELGRAVMTATFARFLGTDPSSLAIDDVLGETRRFWSRYHTWGEVAVTMLPGSAAVTIAGGPKDALLCALVEGSLERIAELTGVTGASATHPACVTRGERMCRFQVTWSAT